MSLLFILNIIKLYKVNIFILGIKKGVFGEFIMRKLLTCIFCAGFAFFAAFFNVFEVIDKTAEDMLYHHPGNIDAQIKIIKIDDKTMNQMGEFSTWNRDVYAQLLDMLWVSDDVHPAVIGFDILFSSEKEAEPDNRF